ncbi:hypothetical protein [Palleronia sp.]|uniref:hypothetical protein n=1 Tax=Palleronia sp. TaxID=1940284 RepID=UPI0035C79645
MEDWIVTASALERGVWTLRLEGGATPPKIEVSHAHRAIPGVKIGTDDGAVTVTAELPREVLSDGLQSVHAVDKSSGITLASLHVAAGRIVARDMTAELSLLRAELELLKKAFRRHLSDS